MNFYQLSFLYLSRKKGKTILLFLVFLFVSSMILSTNMILHSAENSKSDIQEKTKSKIILEKASNISNITKDEVKQILKLDQVASVNSLAYHLAFPANFNIVTNDDSVEKENQTVSLLAYDDLENDSAFFDDQYHLASGTYINNSTPAGAVINSLLADKNDLMVGDKITLKSEDEKMVSVTIVGLFIAGNEQKQTADTTSVHRIENQIFVDNTTYSKLFENDGYYKLVVYSRNPEMLEMLETKLAEIMNDKIEMTTSDTLYKQMKAPLEQITKTAKIMLILTFITGITVISLLLCMWMRTRQTEAAVFMSLGISKYRIYLQVLFESLIVFIGALFGSCGLGCILSGFLQSILTGSDFTLNIRLQFTDIITLLGLGGLTVWITVSFSMFPIIKANPKDILCKIDG